jgi:hypothetical protein
MSININQTKVTICNSALIKLGAATIQSLEDDSREARLCKEQYTKNKHSMLYEYGFNFAKKRKILTPLADSPVWEFEKQFALPSDCIRLLDTDVRDEEIGTTYVVEGNNILANIEKIKILYTADVDESWFSAGAVEVLALRLAIDLSYSLANSNTQIRRELKQEYDELLKVNRSYNSQENGTRKQLVDSGSFVGSRYSGNSGM